MGTLYPMFNEIAAIAGRNGVDQGSHVRTEGLCRAGNYSTFAAVGQGVRDPLLGLSAAAR